MTSIKKTLREEYDELMTYAEAQHECRVRMAVYIGDLEARIRLVPGGEVLITQMRRRAGFDALELMALTTLSGQGNHDEALNGQQAA